MTIEQAIKENQWLLLSYLSDREQFIVVNRFGLGGCMPLTLDEVGSRLGITRERVRQIEVVAINKMRKHAKNHLTKDAG